MSKKFYDLAVIKGSEYSEDDIQSWVEAEVKGSWSKREFKTKINYRFYELGDAFKFRFRWTKT